MTDTVPLTEKLLMDAGGWREMKAARQIHAAGKVAEAEYRDGVLSGLVQDRGKPLRVRVRVRSATNLENACPCPLSRREGAICAHALAVGLEILDPKGPSAAPPETAIETPGASTAAKTAAADDPWPAMTELATDDAEPARLFVVIPPNLAGAWERDRAMAGIEVELAGKRALLASAGKDRTLFLDARDAPLWQALKSLSPDAVPGMLALPRAAFLRLLDALAGHPRVGFGRDRAATIEVRPFRPALRMKDFTLRVDWPAGVVPLCEAGAEVAWVLDGDTFRPVAPGLPAGMRPVFGEGLRLDPALAVPVLEALEEFFEVPAETRAGLPEVLVPSVILDLEGSLNHLEATLRFDYADGARVRPAGSGKAEPVEVAAAPDRVFVTDPAFERRAAARLESLGFAGPDAGGRFALKDKPAILHFFAHGCSRLDPSWKTSAGERFAHARTKVEPVSATFDFQPGGGENWFAMAVEFATPAGEAIPRQEIQRLLQMGQNARALPNGRFAVLDPALVDDLSEAVADCDPRQARPGLFEIDHRHAAYLRETAEASGVAVSGKAPWTRAPAEKLAFGDLGDLAATLRPYQAEGVAWLQSLAERGMGGILADDMGL
ncbi:MAG: hypothetical protein KDM91_17875, partial [Verrucomicrobiae bacterium]|nr:hypothetical protein [Verrucomicrobiae bacterium]